MLSTGVSLRRRKVSSLFYLTEMVGGDGFSVEADFLTQKTHQELAESVFLVCERLFPPTYAGKKRQALLLSVERDRRLFNYDVAFIGATADTILITVQSLQSHILYYIFSNCVV